MKKCAFLLGIIYSGTSNQLKGCINDVKALGNKLQNNFGYTDIVLLTDETTTKPTKKNIIDGLNKLMSDSKSYKEIFFHYSGHGTRVSDTSGDEKDGRDEAIVPLDYSESGFITDDELRKIFSKSQCPVKIVLDCCYSGSGLDLVYNSKFVKGRVITFKEKNTTSSKQPILMLSACLDSQVSYDYYVQNKNKYMGALTSAFINETNNYEKYTGIDEITLEQLLMTLFFFLRKNNFDQTPVISSNMPLNIHSFFLSKEKSYAPLYVQQPAKVNSVTTNRGRSSGGCSIQ